MSARILPKSASIGYLPWQGDGGETAAQPEPPTEPAAMATGPSPAELELARVRAALAGELQAAQQAGYQAGQTNAEQQLREKYQTVIARLTRSMEEVGSSRARYRREAEEDVIRLSLAIARRILHREVTIDPRCLQGLVKAALSQVEAREVTQIRTHPSLIADLKHAHDQVGPPVSWNWTPDPSLAVGDVLIETARGQLDASIQTQLEEIERGFADYLPVKS